MTTNELKKIIQNIILTEVKKDESLKNGSVDVYKGKSEDLIDFKVKKKYQTALDVFFSGGSLNTGKIRKVNISKLIESILCCENFQDKNKLDKKGDVGLIDFKKTSKQEIDKLISVLKGVITLAESLQNKIEKL